MTLAGVWQSTAGPVVVQIDGAEPVYSFRNLLMGAVVAQGTVSPVGPGSYVAVGQGVNGPVRMSIDVQGPDQALLTIVPTTGVPMIDQFMTFAAERHVLLRQRPFVLPSPPAPAPAAAAPEPEPAPKPKSRAAPKPAAAAKPRRRDNANPLAELDRMIGMTSVKDQLRKLDAWAWRQQELRERGVDVEAPSLHMSFAGNPGTGKTTVAKVVGRLLHRYGLIEREEVLEKGRADLVGRYIGHTADQTKKAIEEAIGGVLFIDEAYALSEPGKGASQDYGGEALAVLVAEMENRRHELCVIVAGYPAEMNGFLDANAGLASRISRRIEFPDFTDDELCQVFEAMIQAQSLSRDDAILPLLRRYAQRARSSLPARRWGNARSIRNILEAAIENQALRLRTRRDSTGKDELLRLTVADFAFLKQENVAVY